MYDDKWTEVNNNQNDQNNQSGPQAAGNQTGMGQPARQQVYGLSGQGQPQNQNQGQAYQQPQYQNGRRTSTIIPLRIPIRDRTETAG